MIILGIDTEVTDLKDDAEIIEMGGVLYDTKRNIVLASYGQIYKTEEESAEGAAAVHGISREISLDCPLVKDCLDPWIILGGKYADLIVAHNAAHDHPKVTKAWPSFLDKPWLCTQKDLPHETILNRVTSRRLGHLCVDYGIPTGMLHRAMEDARICAIIAGKHDLERAYEVKLMPRFRLICSGPFLKNVDIYKLLKESPSSKIDNRWYKFNPDGHPKCWVKEGLFEDMVKDDADYIKKITKNKWDFNLERMDPKPY